MLNIKQGRRDFVVALMGRGVSTFGDGVALVALTLRLQADGARPYEIALLLGGGLVPKLLLARAIGLLSTRTTPGGCSSPVAWPKWRPRSRSSSCIRSCRSCSWSPCWAEPRR